MAGPYVQHPVYGGCSFWDYDNDRDIDLADVAEWFVEWSEMEPMP